jgi:excinuclease UvrABC ATPase subunit
MHFYFDDAITFTSFTTTAFNVKTETPFCIDQLDKIIDIDQSPIGRTPRSNPATYTGVFDDISQTSQGT